MVGPAPVKITPAELSVIAQLRERLKDELPQSFHSKSEEDQDLYLVRWARARDLHLENATTMLRNSLQWRKEKNADEAIKLKLHPFFGETFPYTRAGTDSLGQPVILIPLSDWDFRKVLNDKERLAEFDDFVTNFFELMMDQIEQEHAKRKPDTPPITQMTFVVNTKGYPYGQLISFGAIKKILQMAAIYEKHFPEILSKCIFVNCPSYFGMFIAMLKPVIATNTLEKITCYSQIAEWQKDMEGWIDRSILPVLYGGTAK